ncbi:hypothetical protein ACEWY4_005132 [Coilia grayii]|uniref:Adhesion G-protein coupled receptor G2-like n=1 Tax=Coilia grayii TaxID=363190 RepID=A0ABD1KHQ1_9TELE
MATQSGCICRFLRTTVAILFVVHYSEEDGTGTNTGTGYFILVVGHEGRGNINTCINFTQPRINQTEELEVIVNLMEVTDTEGLTEDDGIVSASKANDVLEGLKSVLDNIGKASAAGVEVGGIKGGVLKLDKKKDITVAFSKGSKEQMIVSNPNVPKTGFRWSIDIPAEAVNLSLSANNGRGVAAILRFPTITPDAKSSTILGPVYGISMAASICNLSDTIKLYFENNKTEGAKVVCNSWDGVGKQPIWTEDGCTTVESNTTIICQCSHLTFFAILMSLPPDNGTISESDLSSLTYISYIGCGLSMFFLGVGLFMHYLLRKAKSSVSIQILMNVFMALFLLNLTFLSNEWVANTGNYPGCIIIATLMHYSMLATFTWFAMQALHLYLHLVRMADHRTYKHYMLKMCIPAWVCPAVVVIILASLDKYKLVVITASSGYKAKMCWTTDKLVHYVVNVGYYAVVFLFSLGIFVVMVQRILAARKMKVKEAKNLTIILGLLVLLGITWGVAFFSYGPMLIPSYYIFCILNSFQGLFMFIHYYNHSKDFIEDLNPDNPFRSSTSSNTTASNIYVNHD